jgi:hypothetical protein
MNANEQTALLQFVRERIRSRGFGDLDDRIMEARPREPTSIGVPVLEYLEAVRREMILGSDSVLRDVMARFYEHVLAEDGEPPSGIELELTVADRQAYGAERLLLVGSEAVDDLVRELDVVIGDLRENDD